MQGTLPEEQRLLQDVYTQANEPDGLHAVCHMTHGSDPAAQLRLYRQEGAWSNVLTASDALLRSLLCQPAHQSLHVNPCRHSAACLLSSWARLAALCTACQQSLCGAAPAVLPAVALLSTKHEPGSKQAQQNAAPACVDLKACLQGSSRSSWGLFAGPR